MTKGDRVQTPLGAGTVAYQRMAAPAFSTPEAVSVVLDARRHDPRYTGTIFPAGDVTPEERDCEVCGGSGRKEPDPHSIAGGSVIEPCAACAGTGATRA